MQSSAGHRLEGPPLELVGLDADLHVVLLLHLLHEPGGQFNRHFEFWAKNWLQNCAKF